MAYNRKAGEKKERSGSVKPSHYFTRRHSERQSFVRALRTYGTRAERNQREGLEHHAGPASGAPRPRAGGSSPARFRKQHPRLRFRGKIQVHFRAPSHGARATASLARPSAGAVSSIFVDRNGELRNLTYKNELVGIDLIPTAQASSFSSRHDACPEIVPARQTLLCPFCGGSRIQLMVELRCMDIQRIPLSFVPVEVILNTGPFGSDLGHTSILTPTHIRFRPQFRSQFRSLSYLFLVPFSIVFSVALSNPVSLSVTVLT
ncbi:hypothetical protein EVAR_11114_1 [Eumeta japonica]|uniref:Uncharacterized protein n=1 Tax=Eumeta variegata TaxID=151549 RepID=A0A4C1U3W7_EUMVA|nr:hypothetical protein EVAR_11114_1 [Eumeta japonica]